jgi:hypothetical protein
VEGCNVNSLVIKVRVDVFLTLCFLRVACLLPVLARNFAKDVKGKSLERGTDRRKREF